MSVETDGASRIEDLADRIGLPGSVATLAVSIHKQAIDAGFNRVGDGREIPGALYAAARIEDHPVKPRTIAREFDAGVEADDVVSDMRRLVDTLPYDVSIEDPATYVTRYCDDLGVSEQFKETAEGLCARATEEGVHSGKSPSGFAAGVVYAVAYLLDAPIKQSEVADVSGVSPVTIRNQYRDIIKAGFDGDITPPTPGDRVAIADTVDRILDAVDGVPDVVRDDAKAIVHNLPEADWVENTDPKGVASGVVYVAAKDNRVSLAQDYIGDIAGVSKGTVISRVKDIRAWRGHEAAVEDRKARLEDLKYNRLKELASDHDVDVGATPAFDVLVERLAEAGVDA